MMLKSTIVKVKQHCQKIMFLILLITIKLYLRYHLSILNFKQKRKTITLMRGDILVNIISICLCGIVQKNIIQVKWVMDSYLI